ncbi:hypothetical protein [Fibrella forsythiae]|uniref:Uncharacterized protein n=1 Tax=Fibrella forsythiae TaxID=2817061 RepID=A0ABS3JF62_9BACT|nr:hypothetical protein [Fibrella forsythiae]MBO0948626.1 hypothetical protein [Fibrella forsythiae]
MRTAYDQLTEKDVEQIIGKERMDYYSNFVTETGEGEEREITCVIGDPILATVVNQKGWLQIGTDLYKFKYDKLVLLTSSSSARVAQVDAGSESGSDMILGKVIRRSQPLGNNARLASSDYCLDEYWISNGLLGSQKRRMAGVIEYTEYFHPNGLFYSDVDLYVKHQKRVLGVSWWEVNAPQLGINWSITMDNFSQPSYTETGSVSSDNDGLIRISYPSFCVTGPNGSTDCGRVFSRISTGNWVLCSDGIRRQCYLSK